MPYAPPATSPALPPSKPSALSFSNKENADIKELKDILSTSPQLSTSPRRKSAPESYSRKPLFKVDLPLPLPLPLQQGRPSLVRKKSGEVVKPSLKLKGLSKSEPVTPTFPKFVHFNADLEQIRLFNEAQRPQAVSADVSDEDTDEDDDFDFSSLSEDDDDDVDLEEEPELHISLPNIPMMTTLHNSKPVYVESIFLSSDKRKLQGRIRVQNIAFQKNVNIRYTFDFWSTVSDVSADYAEGIPTKDNKNSFDVFVFTIELIDNSRNPIDGKTMYFAVHYQVDDRDFWDNNNGSNYQVNFKRITSPLSSSHTKKKNSNNNSNNSRNSSSNWSMSSMSSTPRSTKTFDESLCRSPPTLGTSPVISLADSRRKLLGRYDIGLSLSAAQNARPINTTTTSNITRSCQPLSQVSYGGDNFQSFFPNNYVDGMPMSTTSGLGNSNPISIPTSRPIIGSSSYHDLVNQYCFYSGSPPILSS